MKSVIPILIPPGVFLLVLISLFIAGEGAVGRVEGDWANVAGETRRSSEARVAEAFGAWQDELHAGARRAAVSVLGVLRDSAGAAGRSVIFDALANPEPSRMTYEYYDTGGSLSAWSGPAGPVVTPANLERAPGSFVTRGPIYSYLVVVLPVVLNDRPAGHVVGKALFTINHPVNSRLIDGGGLAESFQAIAAGAAGPGVEFLVPNPSAESRPSITAAGPDAAAGEGASKERSYVPLRGITGNDVAYAAIPVPSRSEYTDATRASYDRWKGAAAIGLIFALIGAGAWRSRGHAGKTWRVLALHASLWAARYAMIVLDVPGSFNPWGLFDPSLFASSFAFGAAKSPADLVISAALLAFTLAALTRIALNEAVPLMANPPRNGTGSPGAAAAALVLAGALVASIGPLTRGFHAVARSVVFDSRVELNDPGLVYPGLPAAMLLLGAMLLVFSLILGGVSVVAWARAIAGRVVLGRSPAGAWILVFILAGAGSLLFDVLHPNPLGTPVERLLLTAGTCGICYLAVRRHGARGGSGWPGTILAVSLVSVAALIPFIDEKVHDHDKTLIEAVVRDLARPEDAWMTVLLERSLTALSGETSADVLTSYDPEAVEKLAFTAWAGSVLPAEGNTCSVTFVDIEGSVVSHFHIGSAPHWSRQIPMDEMPRSTRFTSRGTRTVDGRTTPWYRGYAPVFDADSQFAGGVWLGIAPVDPGRILGREQDLLTMSQKYEGRTPDRRVIVAEYVDGKLASASGDDLPFGRPIPGETGSIASNPDGVWLSELVGGDAYETYYFGATDNTVIGVGIEALDTGWHFYSYSRYILFFGSVILLAVIAYGIRRLVPWRGWKFSFRARLVAAFAVVSVIPVVLLAWYNRQSLQQEADRSTDAFLRSETGLVLNEISGRMGMTVPYEIRRFNDEALEEIAGQLNTQVHLYDGPFLHGSSRPDLFAAELIDRRVPGDAYRELYLNGRNFEAVEQSVGSLRYLVGYRAIRAQSGETIGAVAVPSLSRQEIVETDLARRDVILYGIYILVLSIALVIGTGMAGQIARPVGRLTAAARRVSTGDLDVDLETGRGDELGQLETAFKGMTADLRRVQERMVAVERELAWKEMAKQVAHEIKNPLTPMRLSVQHLVSSYQKGAAGFGEVLKTVSTTVLEQIDALSRIASEFSAFARLPRRNVDLCDVHAVVDEAIALFHREGVRFASAYVPGSPVVKADREELRRAFINIFRNSVQAAGQSEVLIGVTTKYDGRVLVLAMTDDGPGMAPEVLKRLFEPNFSTKTDGMGIGLTIVKKTVEDLEGAIDINSTPGKGTTVTIRLPLAEEGDGSDA